MIRQRGRARYGIAREAEESGGEAQSGARGRPRVLAGFMLFFCAALLLCLIAAVAIMALDPPWSDAALDLLMKLTWCFMLATLVFKLGVHLWEMLG
jgi:hypothetical protein